MDRYTRAMSRLLLRLVRMDLSVHGAIPDFNDGRRYLILFRMNLGQQVEVHVGEPIDASQYDAARLGELMAETRGRMEELLGNMPAEAVVMSHRFCL